MTPDPDPARWDAPDDAACRQPSTAHVDWFPERDDPDYDAGAAARAVCRRCPYVEPCVTAAVARRELAGRWGGTGGATRRALRRHWGTSRWPDALAAHLRWLRGEPAEPGDAVLRRAAGAERTHGLRSTFAAGCRCDPCSMAAGLEGHAAMSIGQAVTAWRTNPAPDPTTVERERDGLLRLLDAA